MELRHEVVTRVSCIALLVLLAPVSISCTMATADSAQASVAAWDYEVEIELFTLGMGSGRCWRGRIGRDGVADIEVLCKGDWTHAPNTRLSQAELDEMAAAIEQNDFWQLRGGGIPLVSHPATWTVTVTRGSVEHRVTGYFWFEWMSDDGPQLRRVIDSIVGSIPDPNAHR